MNDKPLTLDRLVGLLSRPLGYITNDHLGPQSPLRRDTPRILDLGIDQGVVMLQIGTDAFERESRPDGVLVHGGRFLRPAGELVGVHGELGLHAFDDGAVVKEEDLLEMLVLNIRSHW
jgi:hypothetical protein